MCDSLLNRRGNSENGSKQKATLGYVNPWRESSPLKRFLSPSNNIKGYKIGKNVVDRKQRLTNSLYQEVIPNQKAYGFSFYS